MRTNCHEPRSRRRHPRGSCRLEQAGPVRKGGILFIKLRFSSMQPCPSAERSLFSAEARALLMLLQAPEEIVSPAATDLGTRRNAKC